MEIKIIENIHLEDDLVVILMGTKVFKNYSKQFKSDKIIKRNKTLDDALGKLYKL